MKRALIFFALALSGYASANESMSNKELFQNIDNYAKIAGVCATYGQMSTFQQKSGIANGDEFIGAFLVSEAERMKLPRNINIVDFCLKMGDRYMQLSRQYK